MRTDRLAMSKIGNIEPFLPSQSYKSNLKAKSLFQAKADHRSPSSDIDRPTSSFIFPFKKSILKEIIADKNLRLDSKNKNCYHLKGKFLKHFENGLDEIDVAY